MVMLISIISCLSFQLCVFPFMLHILLFHAYVTTHPISSKACTVSGTISQAALGFCDWTGNTVLSNFTHRIGFKAFKELYKFKIMMKRNGWSFENRINKVVDYTVHILIYEAIWKPTNITFHSKLYLHFNIRTPPPYF